LAKLVLLPDFGWLNPTAFDLIMGDLKEGHQKPCFADDTAEASEQMLLRSSNWGARNIFLGKSRKYVPILNI
jgi:hypothetical protein